MVDVLINHNFVLPYTFAVSGDKIQQLGFSRVSGLGGEIGVKEWRPLTDPATPIKLPTELVFGDITLERGMDTNGSLASWWNEVTDAVSKGSPKMPRYTLTVTAYGRAQKITGKWNIFAAWPRQVKWGDLDAGASGMLVESLVLANEGVRKL